VDGDGEQEVVVETWNYKLYILDATSGEYEWHYNTDYYFVSPPIVANIDEDEGQEVVFGSGGRVYALNGDTQDELWTVTTGGYNTWQAMADVDNDGKQEIIGVNKNGIFALNAEDGSAEDYTTRFSPTIADFDNDFDLEVAFGTWYLGGGHNRVYVLNATTGDLEWYKNLDEHKPGGI